MDATRLWETACHAKVNLMLAVTGQRGDGFHELVSVVAQVGACDRLSLEVLPSGEGDSLECAGADIPLDASNLVLRAAAAFRARVAVPFGCRFVLEKHLPVGAGLGGGSSDAVGALRLLKQACGGPLTIPELAEVSSEVGSDCPLFVTPEPKVMRGRGERLEALPESVAVGLRGRRVLLFKPPFGISTPWAYSVMRGAAPRFYTPAEEAEKRLAAWCQSPEAGCGPLLHNDFEAAVGTKYVLLPALLSHLREAYRLDCLLSGSGSACFALPNASHDVAAIEAEIQGWLGPEAWVCQTAFV